MTSARVSALWLGGERQKNTLAAVRLPPVHRFNQRFEAGSRAP